MANTAIEAIKITRPVHWVKNLSLFAALIFTHNLTNSALLVKVFWGFVAFNFATSASYIFNDIIDQSKDRLHPVKKSRPIASGRLSVQVATIEAVVLAVLSIYLSSQANLNPLFQFSIIIYLGLQAAYSLYLKNQTTIDILVIAIGFIIRIYAGGFIINAHLSVWFLLCVISAALFLAAGKRRSELNTIKDSSGTTRKSLSKYSRELLNSYVTMFGNAAWMSWALFSFFESPKASLNLWLLLAEISRTTTIDKLLMTTIPVTIYGIMRYEALIFEDKVEAPEKVLLTDKGLLTSIALWMSIVLWVFYVVPS